MNRSIEVKNGCLVVSRELRMEFDTGFDAACSELLQSKEKLAAGVEKWATAEM